MIFSDNSTYILLLADSAVATDLMSYDTAIPSAYTPGTCMCMQCEYPE